MADINVLIQRRNSIINQLSILRARADARRREIEVSQATIAQAEATQPRIERALSRAEASGDAAAAAQARADLVSNQRDITTLQNTLSREQARLAETESLISQLEADLDAINQQINQAQQAGGEVSVGQTQPEAQRARDDAASTQAPPSSPVLLDAQGRVQTARSPTVPSNADPRQQAETTGTDQARVDIQTLMSTPPTGSATPIQPGSSSNQVSGIGQLPRSVPTLSATVSGQSPATGPNNQINPPSPTPGARPGTAVAGDDNTNGVVTRINDIFGGSNSRIVPKSNVLDRFDNYTYNISIYLTNSSEYRGLAAGQPVNLTGANLLMQSGGAPTGQRNQYFPVDFYIDDLSIKSVISGKGTNGAHNAVSMTFRVYEPYGVTFLQRLADATRDYVRNSGSQPNNYAAQAYLMVIKWFGYNADGELVQVANALESQGGSPEPGLIVEKYIPFRFTEIKFRLAAKIAEYECSAVALRDYAPASQTRGIIPYNIELTSVTLQELLGVNLTFGTANRARDTQGRESVTGPATSATRQNLQGSPTSSGTSTSGVGFSNQVGAEFGAYFNDAGQGSVDLLPGSVSGSSLPGQSTAPPKATAAPRPNLVTGLAAALNEFQAELVKNGTYTYPDVYEIIINESILREAKLQPPEAAAGLRSVPMTSGQSAGAKKLGIKQNVDRENKNVAAVAGMSIIQFLDQIVRNSSYILDQQTKIWRKDATGTFVVQPRATGGQVFAWYRIGMDAVPIRDRGIDPKRGDYPYRITYSITPYQVNDSKSAWFPQSRFGGTHKQYQYWFTGLNTSIINYEQTYNYLYYISVNGGQGVPRTTADYREYEQYAFQSRAPEASQGAAGPVFDPAAQAASALYSPGDTAQINLQILGDPAWIQQGEIVSGVPELGQTNYGPFLPNGTINYDSREILFEVTFNTAGDYDIETGLMDVTRRQI